MPIKWQAPPILPYDCQGRMEQNAYSFSFQGSFVSNGLWMTNDDHVFLISHDKHWSYVGFALPQQILLVHRNMNYNKWLWS